MYTTLYK